VIANRYEYLRRPAFANTGFNERTGSGPNERNLPDLPSVRVTNRSQDKFMSAVSPESLMAASEPAASPFPSLDAGRLEG
jgi:hypothetical protein